MYIADHLWYLLLRNWARNAHIRYKIGTRPKERGAYFTTRDFQRCVQHTIHMSVPLAQCTQWLIKCHYTPFDLDHPIVDADTLWTR